MKAVDIGDGGESCQLRLSSVFGTRDFPGIPAKYPGILPIWLIGWGPNQLRLGSEGTEPGKLMISTEFPKETREGAAVGKLAGSTARNQAGR